MSGICFVILVDLVVKFSSKTMWNCGEIYPVLIFRTKATLPACCGNIPRYTDCLNEGLRFGIYLFWHSLGSRMKQGDPKVWNCFTLVISLVDERLFNAVWADSSGQLLPTSIANFIAYGHNYVVITSVQKIIAFKSILWAQYVTVFSMVTAILSWWCASPPLKAMVFWTDVITT